MGKKAQQKKSERKAIARKYGLSMKAGKITCTTCGKAWANMDDFSADMQLCGGEHCPIRNKREADADQVGNKVIQLIQNRSRTKKPQQPEGEVDKSYGNITVNVRTGTVDDPYGRARTEACLYEEVPKVLAIDIRKIQRSA